MDHALPESLSGLDDNKHLFRERALLALGRMLEAGESSVRMRRGRDDPTAAC
jgi:hypothetical protein